MENLQVKELPFLKIKEIVDELYKDNVWLTPYQSFDYLAFTGKGFTARHPENMLFLRERNFILYRNNIPIAVAPLLVNGLKTKVVQLRGIYTGAGNLDLIYRQDISYEEFLFLMEEIKNEMGFAQFIFSRISQKSLICDYLERYVSSIDGVKEDDENCYEIIVPDSYDEWNKSLSKSTRQNIRTSYNRLDTDGKTIKYIYGNESTIPESIFSEIMEVAGKRASEYAHSDGKFIQKAYTFLKKRDPVVRFLQQHNKCFYATVYIDELLAASMIGLFSNDGRMIIPRLSYDSSFSRYSPGGILINETMKIFSEEAVFDGVKSLDLSRGDEKYKTVYGGIKHQNYAFKF